MQAKPIKTKLHHTFLAISLAAYTLMLAPILIVVIYSLLDTSLTDGVQQSTYFTWRWYEKLFNNQVLKQALLNSLIVASATTIFATSLGTLGALAIERGRFPGRRLLQNLTMIPLAMPELVMGISLLIWFSALHMTLGLISIILAHVTFSVSYVMVAVRSSLRGFDPQLIDAARDLGATPRQVYTRLILPLIRPGIIAGALMAFCVSFDDFLISFFTTGVGSDTLPLKLYSLIRFGMSREMYALSSLLFVFSVGVVMAQMVLLRRKR